MTSSSIHQQNNNLKTMKTYNYFLSILLCLITLSCQQVPEDDGWLSEEETKSLKVKVRSADNVEIAYPLYLYAFNKSGKLAASQTINEEGNDMALSLTEGDFQVVAVSGISDDYQLPENPTLDDAIILSNSEGADTPLMVGRADIAVSRSAA